jgi:hypothetical protein
MKQGSSFETWPVLTCLFHQNTEPVPALFFELVPPELCDRIILHIICIFHYARIIEQGAHNCISFVGKLSGTPEDLRL